MLLGAFITASALAVNAGVLMTAVYMDGTKCTAGTAQMISFSHLALEQCSIVYPSPKCMSDEQLSTSFSCASDYDPKFVVDAIGPSATYMASQSYSDNACSAGKELYSSFTVIPTNCFSAMGAMGLSTIATKKDGRFIYSTYKSEDCTGEIVQTQVYAPTACTYNAMCKCSIKIEFLQNGKPVSFNDNQPVGGSTDSNRSNINQSASNGTTATTGSNSNGNQPVGDSTDSNGSNSNQSASNSNDNKPVRNSTASDAFNSASNGTAVTTTSNGTAFTTASNGATSSSRNAAQSDRSGVACGVTIAVLSVMTAMMI
jgi:hypothetical protein